MFLTEIKGSRLSLESPTASPAAPCALDRCGAVSSAAAGAQVAALGRFPLPGLGESESVLDRARAADDVRMRLRSFGLPAALGRRSCGSSCSLVACSGLMPPEDCDNDDVGIRASDGDGPLNEPSQCSHQRPPMWRRRHVCTASAGVGHIKENLHVFDLERCGKMVVDFSIWGGGEEGEGEEGEGGREKGRKRERKEERKKERKNKQH